MKRNQRVRSHIFKLFAFGTTVLVFALALGSVAVWSQEETGIINKVPKHVPLKIEISYEDEEDILGGARIKVTNTSEKPVYYLKFFISTKEDFVGPTGVQYGWPLKYGRAALVTFDERVVPEDIPLKKGESYVFQLPEGAGKRFAESMKESYRAAPNSYLLQFQFLNFGDGSGFVGDSAAPFSVPMKKPL